MNLSDLLTQLIPPYPRILICISIVVPAILGSGILSGVLKKYARWRTGYTRKVLHFLIFFTAVALHDWGGMPAVNVLGVGMGVYVILAVRAGDGNLFYEAMAREKDAPRRSTFIIVPYLATAAGGFASNLLFGESAVMGYVLCGAGDAVAEPVGLMFGKHPYRVPSLRQVQTSERTLEGSASVFVCSCILAVLFFRYFYNLPLLASVVSALVVAVVLTGVEAVSFHGADNFTMQIAGSGLAYLFMRVWL